MNKFIIVTYDLSRESIGGVQNRTYRFVIGMCKFSQFKIIIFNLYYNIPFYHKNVVINNFANVNELHKELNKYLYNNLISFVYFVDYRHILNLESKLLKRACRNPILK